MGMGTQLRIGEVAQLLGVTPKTIRHYHFAAITSPLSQGGAVRSLQSQHTARRHCQRDSDARSP